MSNANLDISIVPASVSDIPTIVNFVYASKLRLTINRLLYEHWPDEAAQLEHCNDVVRGAFQSPECEILKAVDNKTGSIIGHLVLTHYKATKDKPPSSRANDPEKKIPKGMVPEIVDLVEKSVAGIQKDIKGTEHLEITHMYIESAYQHSGIGSQFVQLAVQKAKDADVCLYVCSEPQDRSFFRDLRFKETAHGDMDLSKYAPDEYCGFGVFRLSGMIIDKSNLK